LFPSLDGSEDAVGIGGPDEGLGVGIGFLDEAVDGGLKVDDGSEDAAASGVVGSALAKKPSTALSQEAEVGVK
jgi:hypothetical protein